MAVIQALVNTNRPCGDNGLLRISKIVRHDGEETNLFFLHHEEEKRRLETEAALVGVIRANRKLSHEVVRSLWSTRKSTSSRDFELGRELGILEKARNQICETGKTLSSLQTKKRIPVTREVEEKQDSIITPAARSATDCWWDILPTQQARFENILQSNPNKTQSFSATPH